MNRSLKFAHLLAAELRDGKVDAFRGICYRVTGRLDTKVCFASLEIRVWWLFRDVKRKPPAVLCREDWMRQHDDWHNGPSGMCWVLADLWRDAMSWKRKPVRAILDEGRAWLFNDVRCLINRHYLAHLEGFTQWPREWDSWAHFGEGTKEYEREKRRMRRTDVFQRRI
jgi:hypothetical protein